MLFVLLFMASSSCICENTCYNAFIKNGECNDGMRPNTSFFIPEGYQECALGTDCDDCGMRC